MFQITGNYRFGALKGNRIVNFRMERTKKKKKKTKEESKKAKKKEKKERRKYSTPSILGTSILGNSFF
jgi:hypothetical protein